MYEVVTQLRGEAGARQIKKADIGLTHNLAAQRPLVLSIFFEGGKDDERKRENLYLFNYIQCNRSF